MSSSSAQGTDETAFTRAMDSYVTPYFKHTHIAESPIWQVLSHLLVWRWSWVILINGRSPVPVNGDRLN